MKEKQFDPAGQNENSPAPGMAAVNTHNPDEKEPGNIPPQQVMNEEEMKRVEKDQSEMPNATDQE
ncbi:MAG: hypothetical protein ACXWB9_09605 [Flavisolibacter sp.]